MGRSRWDHPDEFDQTVLLAIADGPRRHALHDRIRCVTGRVRARKLGRYPRFQVVLAATAPRRSVARGPSTARGGRPRPDAADRASTRSGSCARRGRTLAILAFGASTDASDAIAAVMSGADFFHEFADGSARSGSSARSSSRSTAGGSGTDRAERGRGGGGPRQAGAAHG